MKVNKQKNLAYYQSEESLPCDCACCKNFVLQIQDVYPEITAYLSEMNVDILRPFELIWIEDHNTIRYLLCQYIIYGTYDEKFTKEISGVFFGISDCHPSTNIMEEHFVLEFGEINLKMKG